MLEIRLEIQRKNDTKNNTRWPSSMIRRLVKSKLSINLNGKNDSTYVIFYLCFGD